MINEQLLSRLKQPLSKDLVKTRVKAGVTLSYMAGFNSERQANDIFDFNWSSETIYNQLIFKREYVRVKDRISTDMVEVAYECKVRISVEIDGKIIIREGTGAGNGSSKLDNVFDAYELAMKEAETDARKRALKTFGDQFGLSLYDKDIDLHKEAEKAKKYDLVFIDEERKVSNSDDENEIRKSYKEYNGSYANEIRQLCVQRLRVLKAKKNENS
jgi:DNA repair and recombination protein RAD52